MRNAILCRNDDPSSAADAESVTITGLWSIKAGTQIATASMTATVLNTLTKTSRIVIGWTMARIRKRAPTSTRFYRCHGFGHTKYTCKGPECRRCGTSGQLELQCTAGNERCVACEREGYRATEHRTCYTVL